MKRARKSKLVTSTGRRKSILTIDNTTSYLLDKRLVEVESIVEGDLIISDASRKNRNMRVICRRGSSYLIKQPNIGDIHSAKTIKTEFQLYNLIEHEPKLSAVRSVMPKVIHFDDERNILILEFINDGISLLQYIYSLTIKNFPIEAAFVLGKSMSVYHKAFKEIDNSKSNFLPCSIPLNLSIFRPSPAIFTNISPANLELLKIIQRNPVILDLLDRIYAQWQSETLIHGDMRWDNVIVTKSNSKTLKIVDWELARIGDPAWDIGGALHDFISYWINFLPMTNYFRPEKMIANTEYPLQLIKKNIRSFWKGYIKTASIPNSQLRDLLSRAATFCAGRLIQSIYESHVSSSILSNTGIYMIQLSLNIMENVDDALIFLLGIPSTDFT